jgi:hypothetical protein
MYGGPIFSVRQRLSVETDFPRISAASSGGSQSSGPVSSEDMIHTPLAREARDRCCIFVNATSGQDAEPDNCAGAGPADCLRGLSPLRLVQKSECPGDWIMRKSLTKNLIPN